MQNPHKTLQIIKNDYKQKYFQKLSLIYYIFFILAIFCLVSGIVSLAYTTNNVSRFATTSALNSQIITDAIYNITDIDTHYMYLGNASTCTIHLPSTVERISGNFVSLTIPQDVDNPGTIKSLYVVYEGRTATITPDYNANPPTHSALFMVAKEKGILKWKHIR